MFHSQIGQDIWLVERALPGVVGYFVDCGAFDGLRFSNTAALEAQGWRGICVEAAPDALALLRRNRPGAIVVEALVDGEARDRHFDGGRGMLSYALDAGAEARAGARPMRSRTLADILDEHGAPAEIDYLSVDIEGAEADALLAFPFDRYRFAAMTIEVHSRGRASEGALLDRLHSFGYARTGRFFSDWFMRPGAVEDADQEWIDEVLTRRIDPRYLDKPEVAHIPWIAARKAVQP